MTLFPVEIAWTYYIIATDNINNINIIIICINIIIQYNNNNNISSGYSHCLVTLSDNYLMFRFCIVSSLVICWYNLESLKERELFNSQYGHYPV